MGKVSALPPKKGWQRFPVMPNDRSSTIKYTYASVSQVLNEAVLSVSSPPNGACSKPDDDLNLTLHPAPPRPPSSSLFNFFFFFWIPFVVLFPRHDYLIQGWVRTGRDRRGW